MISSFWSFLKEIKWHVMFTPIYIFLGIWVYNLLLLITCIISRNPWYFSRSSRFECWGLIGEVSASSGNLQGAFTWIWAGICFAFCLIFVGLLRLIPTEHTRWRRIIAILGILLPTATALQMVNIYWLADWAISWILVVCVIAMSLAACWHAVGVFAGNHEQDSSWSTRIMPLLLILSLVILGGQVTHMRSHLWRYGRYVWIRHKAGPMFAEIDWFKRSRCMHGSAEQAGNFIELERIARAYPQDPNRNAALLRLFEVTSWNLPEEIVRARKFLDMIEKNPKSDDWLNSRLYQSELFSELTTPPDLNSALAELEAIPWKRSLGLMELIYVLDERARLLIQLGRKEEALRIASTGMQALDAYVKESGTTSTGVAWEKASLYAVLGNLDKVTASLKAAASPNSDEEKSLRVAQGMCFDADPLGKIAPEIRKAKDDSDLLSRYRGQPVLLTLFTLPNLSHVRTRLRITIKAEEKLQKAGIKLLFVTCRGENEAQAVRDIGTNSTVHAMEGDFESWKAWGMTELCHNYLLSEEGIVVARGVFGPDLVKQAQEALNRE